MSHTETLPSLEEIIDALRISVAAARGLDAPAVAADENMPLLEGGLGLDSVMLVEMIADIEQRLGFSFLETDLRMRSFGSLRTLAEIISARLASDESTA